jgi:hypothetical protein
VTSTLGTISQSSLENTIMGPTTSELLKDSPSQKKPLLSSKPGDPVKSHVVVPTSVRVDDIADTKFSKPFVLKVTPSDIDVLTLVLNDWRTEQFNYLQRKFVQ